MKNSPLLERHITVWYHHKKSMPIDEFHLSDVNLFSMAMPGGLALAEADMLNHLSLCPLCLDRWDELSAILGVERADDPDENDIILGQGFLKTGSGGTLERLRMMSKCSRFIFSIFPSKNENSGTAVFEAAQDAGKSFEDIIATVCDARGNVIIHGPVRKGTLARKVFDLDKFDLKQWSVIMVVPKGDKPQ